MSNTVIVTLGQLVDTNPMRTVNKFRDLGIGIHSMIWQYQPLMALIDQYKKGLATVLFMVRTLRLFGVSIKREDFNEAWNAQSVVTDESVEKFKDILNLISEGVNVVIVSSTNELHWNHIKEQLKEKGFKDSEIDTLKERMYLSFEKIKIGSDLLDLALQEQNEDNTYMMLKQPSIAFFDWKSPLEYLTYGFKYILYWRSSAGFENMKQSLSDKGATAVAWDFAGEQKESLISVLKREEILKDEDDTPELEGAKVLKFSKDKKKADNDDAEADQVPQQDKKATKKLK